MAATFAHKNKNERSGQKVNAWQATFSLPIPKNLGKNLDVTTILKVLGHRCGLFR